MKKEELIRKLEKEIEHYRYVLANHRLDPYTAEDYYIMIRKNEKRLEELAA